MKPERFTAGIFLCVIVAFMLLTFYGVGAKTKNLIDEPKIKWEKIYPFEDGRKETLVKKSPSLFNYIKVRIEKYTSEKLPCYYKILEVAKKYENVLGWNMVSVFDYNAVFKLKDGYLTTYKLSLDVTPDAEAVKDFSDFCAEMGIDFMYIIFPAKVCISDDKEISGVLEFANQNADKFLAILKESGVRNYDFRKNLHEAGMNHHEAFFITDHHWKPETGLWAAGEILKILRNDLSWDVEPGILSPKNFEYVIYPDCFLGSQGKKLTLSRAKPEDITIIYPKFETRLHIEIPNIHVNVSGDFTDFYDMRQVKDKDYYNLNSYDAYSYGDHDLIRADNKLVLNRKRLLVVRDSFSVCVIPFLSLGVQHFDAIDLRRFSGSLKTFILNEKPDAVIVEYSAGMLGRFAGRSAPKEDNKLHDFR